MVVIKINMIPPPNDPKRSSIKLLVFKLECKAIRTRLKSVNSIYKYQTI